MHGGRDRFSFLAFSAVSEKTRCLCGHPSGLSADSVYAALVYRAGGDKRSEGLGCGGLQIGWKACERVGTRCQHCAATRSSYAPVLFPRSRQRNVSATRQLPRHEKMRRRVKTSIRQAWPEHHGSTQVRWPRMRVMQVMKT